MIVPKNLLKTCFALAVSSLCGCAFVDQKVALTYEPVVGATGGSGALVLAQSDSTAIRQNKKGLYVIGNVRNGFKMKTADLVTRDSPGDWFANALQTELSRAGYQVTVASTLPSETAKGLKPIVEIVWVEHDMGAWQVGATAQVGVRVEVYKNGERVETISSKQISSLKGMVGGTASQKRKALQPAMEACMQEVVPKILKVLEG